MRVLARSLRLLIGTTAVLALALLLAGCAGDTSSPPPTTTAPVAAETSTTETTTTETETTAAQAPCSPADFLPVLELELTRETDELRIERVEVTRCRNDFARVSAIPDMKTCPPSCFDTAEVYLRWTGGTWRILDVGTGIPCEETTTLPPLPAKVRQACQALGYPQPAILDSPSFQMPSRNIGCALTGTVLRCDVLSGLKPEPGRACELDWVGLALAADDAAEPICAGDTAYDQAAPTLAYGDLWHRADFWCASRKTGLVCMNTVGGGSFELARSNWSG